MAVPENATRAQRDHPQIYCGNAECEKRLPSNWLAGAPCPHCNSAARDYRFTRTSSVHVTGHIESVREFYERRWWVLGVQVLLVLVIAGFGLLVAGPVGVAVGTVVGLAQLLIPGWSVHNRERFRA